MNIRRGIVRTFNPATYIAKVEIPGWRPNVLTIPAAKHLAANLLTAGSKVVVLFFDETNPNDAVVLGSYDGAPSAWIAAGLLIDDYLTPTEHTAIGDTSPHHAEDHAARHGHGGADELIHIADTEPATTFAGSIWVDTG